MTVHKIMKQARALTVHERKELAKLLIDTLDTDEPGTLPKTGAEIVAMLELMEPLTSVDPQIEDPVLWVKEQRRKRKGRLKDDEGGER